MWLAKGWDSVRLLDCGDGEKLERWGEYILRRPDPQAIWPVCDASIWKQADAWYHRSAAGGGEWEFLRPLPPRWEVAYGELRFLVRPTNFKHTGLFPEQAVNWDWMGERLRGAGRKANVLNLFAYTGGASLACAKAGADVVHVDAAKGMVAWAKENAALCGLEGIRYIVEDALKFVQREQRRGRRYDGIVMDPPSYGRGPDGQVWKLEDALYGLVEACAQLLAEDALFFLINSYTTGLQPGVLSNILLRAVAAEHGGTVVADEIGLPSERGGLVLPCGASGRWEKS